MQSFGFREIPEQIRAKKGRPFFVIFKSQTMFLPFKFPAALFSAVPQPRKTFLTVGKPRTFRSPGKLCKDASDTSRELFQECLNNGSPNPVF